jgi:hypothetical protein
VRLKAGERWRYEPPAGHTVLWVAIASGVLSVPDGLRHGDLAAFEPSSEEVEFEALTDAEFVLGSAAPHEHDLVLGHYSVHTSLCPYVAGRASRCRGAHLLDQGAPRSRRPSVRVAQGWTSALSVMVIKGENHETSR